MLGSELIEVPLGGRVLAQKEHGGFGEGPLEMDIADLGARGAVAFAGGLFGALDQRA